MHSLDNVYSINLGNNRTPDREHSPYFCNQEIPKQPYSKMANDCSFEFNPGFNVGLTLDKYFGGNFKVIQLKQMEVDETFDIYTRSRKNQTKTKSYHCKNDSENHLVSTPNEFSMGLIKESEESPYKVPDLNHMRKTSYKNKDMKSRLCSTNLITNENDKTNELSLKNINNSSLHNKKIATFKRSLAQNKSLSPFFLKNEKNSRVLGKSFSNKMEMKEKEMLKSYQLSQILKKEKLENHIVFRKISQPINKKQVGYLVPILPKASIIDPLSKCTDLGLGKTLNPSKNSLPIKKKLKGLSESKNGNNIPIAEQTFLGGVKGMSRKEIGKKMMACKNKGAKKF